MKPTVTIDFGNGGVAQVTLPQPLAHKQTIVLEVHHPENPSEAQVLCGVYEFTAKQKTTATETQQKNGL